MAKSNNNLIQVSSPSSAEVPSGTQPTLRRHSLPYIPPSPLKPDTCSKIPEHTHRFGIAQVHSKVDRHALNTSEMYFKNSKPKTTCLYSAESMYPHFLLAAIHSFSSKPSMALFLLFLDGFNLFFGMESTKIGTA